MRTITVISLKGDYALILFKANFLFLFQLYYGYNKLDLFLNIFTVMKEQQDIARWLPTTKKEVEMRGWNELDVILVSIISTIGHPMGSRRL